MKQTKVRKYKESCLRKGRFQFSSILLRFGNTIRLTPLGAPPSGECTPVELMQKEKDGFDVSHKLTSCKFETYDERLNIS
jgi:hypothetical protein